MKLPNINDKVYWKDSNGLIHEDTCLEIRDNQYITTNIYPSGSSMFIDKDDLINPKSEEVLQFKKKKIEEEVQKIANCLSSKEVYNFLYEKLLKNAFSKSEAYKILNILSYGT